MPIVTSQFCRVCKEVTTHANGVCDSCFEEDRVTVRSYVGQDGFSNPRHPIWALLTIVTVNGSLLAYFAITTTKWDTEPWILAAVFSGTALTEAAKYFKSTPTSKSPQ